MGTKPDFLTNSVINDSGMMDAFKEGLAEGTANRHSTVVYVVSVAFEGTKLNERTFEDKDEAMAYTIENLDTVGQEVHIKMAWQAANYAPAGARQDSAPAELDQGGDDDVVDAEVLE